jgi:hypothetical protein
VAAKVEARVVWQPQPKQAIALACPVFEILYGGAKGGGKSDWLLAGFLQDVDQWGPDHRGVIFRKTYPQLEELQIRARVIYGGVGARYKATEHLWTFPSGSTLKFRHLDRDASVDDYQGQQYTYVGFDQLEEWKSDYCYVFLMSCARSAAGAPVRVRATANPGGVGHVWLKNRFILPVPPMQIYADPKTTMQRVFIPARLEDNPKLLQADPRYEDRLRALPQHLYKAYRFGDWDISAGQFFDEWNRDKHMVKPFPLHPSWFRFGSLDWGYARPYALQWWALTGDGRMVLYREWYGCDPEKHNVGIKRPAAELAKDSWAVSTPEGCRDLVIDPACWSKTDADNPSIAERFEAAGWTCHKGNNDRVSGAARFHEMLKTTLEDGRPAMLAFNTCVGFGRTIPDLIADETDAEDVDTDGEDHCYDSARYALMSPLTRRRVAPTNLDITGRPSSGRQYQAYDPLARR